MKATEHNAKAPSTETGFLAMLASRCHRRGSGAPSSASAGLAPSPRARGRRFPTPFIALAAALLLLALGAAPASAAEAPYIREFQVSRERGSATGELELYSTRVTLYRDLYSNELSTPWRIEYATSEALLAEGKGSLIDSGTASATESHSSGFTRIHHLTPSTTYYARLTAENELGKAEETITFTTLPPAAAEIQREIAQLGGFISSFRVLGSNNSGHAVGTTFVELEAILQTNGREITEYSFATSTSESGPWTTCASGSVTVAEDFANPTADCTGLSPETTHYFRLIAVNEIGEDHEIIQIKTRSIKPQAGPPSLKAVTDTSAHPTSQLQTGTYETHWRFEYAPAEPNGSAPAEASSAWVEAPGANGVLPGGDEAGHEVAGDLTGLSPATHYYVRLRAENVNGTNTGLPHGFETAGPPSAETFATHAIHGEAMRALGSVFPHGLDTHYRVQYVSQEEFAKTEWTSAEETPELDAGTGVEEESGNFKGYGTKLVGADFPPLEAGVTYRYRLLATNAQVPAGVFGEARTLTVPDPGKTEDGGEEAQPSPCPNQALRTGPSANLPDCRAYEQLTPVDKGGAQEIFAYHGVVANTLVGEDGDHFALHNEVVHWGSGPTAGGSPYFFSREAGSGWRMTAAAAQPEAGIHKYAPEIYDANLTRVGFSSSYNTGPAGPSPFELKVGTPGGPYVGTPPIPSQFTGAWVGGSPDLSKLILQTTYHKLLGTNTGTKQGADLYEYSEGNLSLANGGIGTCGARLPAGTQGSGESTPGRTSHAVSADGRRVFLEAVPGANCSAPSHLYMRLDGQTDSDLGAYSFRAANALGTEVLLEKQLGGEASEFLLYDTETQALKPLFSIHSHLEHGLTVSEDLSAIYFLSRERLAGTGAPPRSLGDLQDSQGSQIALENLYRYDIPAEALRFVVQTSQPNESKGRSQSPDGRYFYWEAWKVAGLPGGNPPPQQVNETGEVNNVEPNQVYRYDSATGTVQCFSCASPFNPEPALPATLNETGAGFGPVTGSNQVPNFSVASANGDFVFFDTASALVPADVDGEVAPENTIATNGLLTEHRSSLYSPSSDVYEWRKDGIDGCTHVQGCLSLITSGRGGFLIHFLGTAHEGRDAFFATDESLLPSDNDTAGDVYDARIGGGFPAPSPRPVECEGDACSNPTPAPNDPTPSSSTYSGPGNERPPSRKHRKHHKHHKHKKAKKHHARSHKRASANRGGGK